MKSGTAVVGYLAIGVFCLAFAADAPKPATISYGTITLTGGGGGSWQAGLWNLNAGPVTISYSLDLTGAPNVSYDWNWSNMGIVGLRHPGGDYAGAQMVGFLGDWNNPGTQFPTYPDNDGSLDNDDKFNLQRFPNPGSYDESMYDVQCDSNTVVAPFGSGNNYGIWYDRDGVDQWQASMWGMVNGGTYNTNGIYPLRLLIRKESPNRGTACPVFFPALANTWDPSGFGIRTGFYSSWVPTGPQMPNAGLSFDTDEVKMAAMQVLVDGSPAVGSIIVRDLFASGFMDSASGKDLCKQDGWKRFTNPVFRNQGQCVSYFVSSRP